MVILVFMCYYSMEQLGSYLLYDYETEIVLCDDNLSDVDDIAMYCRLWKCSQSVRHFVSSDFEHSRKDFYIRRRYN